MVTYFCFHWKVKLAVSHKIAPIAGDPGPARSEQRARILNAALTLLERDGRDAVTTRAVAEAAGVQPPVLYRLFGDKRGLLDALAEHGFTAYLSQKQLLPVADDPVEALRSGWDLHVDFGLAHRALYLVMFAEPMPGVKSAAAEASVQMLRKHVRRVAASGRLRVSEERAANLFHAAGSGTVLTLLGMPQGHVDMMLSALAREAVLTAMITKIPIYKNATGVEAAIGLRALVDDLAPLTEAERLLLQEWLDRLARG